MSVPAQIAKPPSGRIKRVLMWSALTTLVMTAAGSLLAHPWRVLPAALGAMASPVAFVSMSLIVWRVRHQKSPRRWVEESYGSEGSLRFNQILAALVVILMGFMAAFFALVFNLLHTFNVK